MPCSFAYKVVCINDRFSKKIVLYGEKNAANKFMKAIINEYKYCQQITKAFY